MEEEVGEGAGALLGGRVRGLEDEGGLRYDEEAGLGLGSEYFRRVGEEGRLMRALLTELRSGCAETKMMSWVNTAPQMMAASCTVSDRVFSSFISPAWSQLTTHIPA